MVYEEFLFNDIKYIVRYPEGYKQGEKYPVILFLHGAGTRGDDIDVLKHNMYFDVIDRLYPNFRFVTVAPLCNKNSWFDHFETLIRFVYSIRDSLYCDNNRLYLIGVSMGAYAAWQLAMSVPEAFAALVPICGGGMYWNAARLVNVPVWAFHGDIDKIVCTEESEKMVKAVNLYGGNARLTVYENTGHDAWTRTFSDPSVFEWLLEQENVNASVESDLYKGSGSYG